MTTYLIQRILQSMLTLLFLTIIAFTFLSLAPGDAIDAMIPPDSAMTAEELARQREALGLDRPVVIQYLAWVGQVVKGNLGFSLIFRRPVILMICERLWPTVQLGILAIAVSTLVGIAAGIFSGLNQYTVLDQLVSILSYGAFCIPNFYLGLMMIYVFSVKLKWLPSAGMFTPGAPFTLADRIRHLILPVAVLSVQFIGIYARQTRSAILEVLNAEYVRTARAKGLVERLVTVRHILPNAAIPVITVIGTSLPLVVTGALVTEMVFSWSGMGVLTVNSITNRDYPLLMGIVLLMGVAVSLANLVVDIAYAIIDPRIRYR